MVLRCASSGTFVTLTACRKTTGDQGGNHNHSTFTAVVAAVSSIVSIVVIAIAIAIATMCRYLSATAMPPEHRLRLTGACCCRKQKNNQAKEYAMKGKFLDNSLKTGQLISTYWPVLHTVHWQLFCSLVFPPDFGLQWCACRSGVPPCQERFQHPVRAATDWQFYSEWS